MAEIQPTFASTAYDAIVVGGGFYGARLALHLRRGGSSTLLLEREGALLSRASLRNQARVHNGYHYPRSVLTALRSRANYDRFAAEYPTCIAGDFSHYYAIARGSKVSPRQFEDFCGRIGSPIGPAPRAVVRLFDDATIDAVFEVQECAFDAVALRGVVEQQLGEAGVHCRLGAEVVSCGDAPTGEIVVTWQTAAGERHSASTPLVLNCTYAGLNELLHDSGVEPIGLSCELAEMAVVTLPPELDGIGVTVMDGPYFSCMPHPPRPGLHTLSHVRYTPHARWPDDGTARVRPSATARATRFPHMVRDAARYLPSIRGARYVDSVWELKAILPRSDRDDSRPILLRACPERPGLLSVLGAKIDSVYDVEDALDALLSAPVTKAANAHG